ncbi:MAG: radical SAM protein [Oscillospiraceae bacterium]|nr:radical SAM protein [Oscillospiraceae bacterium]
MRYILNERFALRGWEKLPYAVADRTSGRAYFISGREMEALKLCSGKIETDLPLIPEELRNMLPVLEKNGIIRPAEQGEALMPEQEYRKYPARYIRTAHWSVTGRCNYRCRHCYMSAPDAKFGELSHEQIMKMVRELSDCGVMNVSLTGGEPLVRGDFLEIVDALTERGIRITQIYSNGALVREPLLRALEERGVRPEFNMSYDGPGTHDWLRGVPGAEEAVDRAFRLCRDMGFPTGAEMCLHQGNKHLLRETVNRLHDAGCRSLKTCPVSDVGEWRKNGYGKSISAEELFGLYLDYIPHYYEDGMPLSLMLGGLFAAGPAEPERWDVPLYHRPGDPKKSCVCAYARTVMYISAEGRALPCMSLSGMDIREEFPLITEEGLSKCITDSRYMDYIDTRADKVLGHNPECAECIWKKWCLGGCRASGLEGSGQTDLLYKDPAACAMFREGWIGRLAELMKLIRPEASGPVMKDEELMKHIYESMERE